MQLKRKGCLPSIKLVKQPLFIRMRDTIIDVRSLSYVAKETDVIL